MFKDRMKTSWCGQRAVQCVNETRFLACAQTAALEMGSARRRGPRMFVNTCRTFGSPFLPPSRSNIGTSVDFPYSTGD